MPEDSQYQTENRAFGLGIGFDSQETELGDELLLPTQATDVLAMVEK